MSLIERMFGPWYGHKPANRWTGSAPAQRTSPPIESTVLSMAEARAVGRYRYLLRAAPPGQVELAHEEAFESLTPRRRTAISAALAAVAPGGTTGADDPIALARVATQAERQRPGTLERVLGGAGLLAAVATAFVGSAAADLLFDDSRFDDGRFDDGRLGRAPGSLGGSDRR